jgi:hypothetical protein
MMLKSLSFVAFTVLGVAIAPILIVPPLSAQQQKPIGNLEVVAHLEPNDAPYAGKPSAAWFMLMRRNGDVIAPTSCDCSVAVYDNRKQAIERHLPLSVGSIAGHRQEHRAIRTTITFPKAGAYTVVLSGRSTDGSFNPFVLKFPAKVRP